MTSLTFADFFSGVGGFRLGLQAAGHRCVYACEIDPFARAVYEHRFGHAPQGSDINAVSARDIPDADIWCAGSPCQDVSSSGKRAGIHGDRSGLVWRFLDLAAERKPEWILWENVPGFLTGFDETSDVERDGEAVGFDPGYASWFGTLLGAFRERGYVGGAYRALDAVRLGVAQYRRRVFVLARRSREGTRPGEVLLEPQDVRRDLTSCLAPRTKAAAGATLSTRSTRFSSDEDEVLVGRDNAFTLKKHDRTRASVEGAENLLVLGPSSLFDAMPTLRASDGRRREASGDAREPIIFDRAQVTSGENRSACEPGAPSVPLGARTRQHVVYNVHSNGSNATDSWAHEAAASRCLETRNGNTSETLVLFDAYKDSHGHGTSEEASSSLKAQSSSPQAVEDGLRIRRLTPLEWERLMGLPDGWTAIPWRKKPIADDSPRYEALGNGVVPNVVKWIGRRLAMLA